VDSRQGAFENRVLKIVFGPKRVEVAGDWRNCIMRSFITYTPLET
jgi:hypothetical protein